MSSTLLRLGLWVTLLAIVAVLVVQASGRTIWAILAAGGGVAVAFPVLAHVYGSGGGNVSAANANAAALVALGAGAATAVVWGAGTAVTDRVRARGGGGTLRRASRLGLATVAVLAIVAAGIAAGPISRETKK